MAEEQYQDLLGYLVDRFEAHLTELNPGMEAMVEREVAQTKSFVKFASEFLTENRLQGIFPSDDNYGLILSNGARVLVCKPGDALYVFGSSNNVDTSGAMPVVRR